MSPDKVMLIALIAMAIIGAAATTLFEYKLRYLKSENRMLRRLLAEQARLHEMSLDAYAAMAQEAKRHINSLYF